MNIGMIGAGLIGKELLMASQNYPTINVMALLSREASLSKNQKICSQYNIKTIYTTYDEMLSNPDIEVIYVAVPNQLHYYYSRLGLEHGKHVICEKPFTITTKEAQSLKSIALEHNCMIFEAISTIHLQNFKAIKSLIDDKILGQVKVVTCNFSKISSRYRDFKAGHIQPAFDPSKYGGALMDLNCYNFHFIYGLFNQPLHMEYYPNLSQNIDTSGTALFRYEDFICISTAAKDSNGKSSIEIQGDANTLLIESPSSLIESYSLYNNSLDTTSYNHNLHEHRMINTFLEIMAIIEDQDYNHCHELLDHSIQVVQLMEKAGQKVFKNK